VWKYLGKLKENASTVGNPIEIKTGCLWNNNQVGAHGTLDQTTCSMWEEGVTYFKVLTHSSPEISEEIYTINS
jgi:hypothetical protein